MQLSLGRFIFTLFPYHLQAAWLLGPKGCGPNLLITQASRDGSLGPTGSSLFTGSATTSSTGSLFNVPASQVVRVTKHQQGGGQPQQGGPGGAGSSSAAASSAVPSLRGGASSSHQQQQQQEGASSAAGAGEEGGGRRWVELPIGTNAAGRAMAGLAAATIISAVPPVVSSGGTAEVLPGAVVPAVLPSSAPDVLPFAPAEALPSSGEGGSERGSSALPSGLEHVIASVESGVLAGVGRGGSAGIQAACLSQIA